mmetsp:Transcript_18278/g.38018  ORF Transcript_18278/g.38018 Transcript_18278/m.38018 type:complete len:216 (-) Transcript_18278:497-1144(-)
MFTPSQNDTRALLRVHDSNVLQMDVPVLALGSLALCERNIRPTDGAGMGRAEPVAVRLLSRSYPDWPLGRGVDIHILVENVLDEPPFSSSELHVNALITVVHVDVPKSDVLDGASADATDGYTNPRRLNPLKEHVGRSILDCNGIVLAPHRAVVNPDVIPGDIIAVSVEGCDIPNVVVVPLSPPRFNLAEPDLQAVNAMHPEGPVGGILEKYVLD